MDNLFQNNSGEKTEHPPREMLLLFVDGELQTRDAEHLEAHLEACWPCRVKTQKIQDTIEDIIEFDDHVLTPRLVPPEDWRKFDQKLNQLAAISGKQSFSSRLFGSLSRFLPMSDLSETARAVFKPAVARSLIALLLLAVLITVAILFKQERTVSASQLIANAIDAQAQQIHSTSAAVVHQRLKVTRKDWAEERVIELEIWDDTANSRVRQFIADSSHSTAVMRKPSSAMVQVTGAGSDLIFELQQALRVNHMDPTRPLSAVSYQSWRNTLQGQQDEITKLRLSDGNEATALRTIAAKPITIGQISETTFLVRSSDWLPIGLRIDVSSEQGNRIYELAQTALEVVNLGQVNPSIFADESVVSYLNNSTPKESPNTEVQPTPAAPTLQPLSPRPVATAELEIEALRLLNQAGADLGEQITVKRETDGLLHITGIVETDKREREIGDALKSLANNPAVRVEIQTVAEAVAQQTSKQPTPLPSTRSVEIVSNAMAAEPELRAYFAGTQDADQAVRQYAARMISLSGRGMDHLWAMKRLLNHFSPEAARALPVESRSKWLSLIRSHAHAFQQTNESLRRELHPIFFAAQSLDSTKYETPATDINELMQVVNQLFEVGSSNDRVVRSAFTVSSNAAATTVIKTPQFWQSLKSAEILALRISRAE